MYIKQFTKIYKIYLSPNIYLLLVKNLYYVNKKFNNINLK